MEHSPPEAFAPQPHLPTTSSRRIPAIPRPTRTSLANPANLPGGHVPLRPIELQRPHHHQRHRPPHRHDRCRWLGSLVLRPHRPSPRRPPHHEQRHKDHFLYLQFRWLSGHRYLSKRPPHHLHFAILGNKHRWPPPFLHRLHRPHQLCNRSQLRAIRRSRLADQRRQRHLHTFLQQPSPALPHLRQEQRHGSDNLHDRRRWQRSRLHLWL